MSERISWGRGKRVVTFAGAFALPLSLVAAAVACGSTATTTAFTPQTGIVVRSESLTTGIGCGTGATQIFKFVAVVIDGAGNAGAAGLYDCFADGVLVNLQSTTDGGNTDFTVKVYAFNQAAYTASQSSIATDVSQANTSPPTPFNGGAFSMLGATYSTNCTATQQSGIQVVAVCEKLAASTPTK